MTRRYVLLGVSLYRHCILLGNRNELATRRNASRTPHGGLVLCCSFAVHLLPPIVAIDERSIWTISMSSSVPLFCYLVVMYISLYHQ
ncbi:uncharacterized protein BJ212DRAFT_1401629 [Suillus subaureus]|uniref:Uncharacterized protein n=1 Tax=Suillus subaureus TaxID=48587 RepID=A0A9P7J2F1_9AGAM|nr:uncharacterized protein BJ212DRAFT_1401629 [Suillus subaureus]KAG1799647.1 hypothetical protein BJ212DRAFT_1401629 [Suillus subaureus]